MWCPGQRRGNGQSGPPGHGQDLRSTSFGSDVKDHKGHKFQVLVTLPDVGPQAAVRQSWGPHSLVPMKSCKADLLGQDMSLDELIEKDYLPPKVRTVNLGAMLNFESAVMLGWRETTHIWGPVQCPFRSPRHFRAKEKVGPMITTGHKSQAGHGAKCSKDWALTSYRRVSSKPAGRQQKLGKSKLGEDQNHHRRRSAGEKCCSLKDLGKLGPYVEVS